MDYNSLLLPSTSLEKNVCRTCLMESAEARALFMNIQDLIEHDDTKIKLIDILVYLNCLENNDEENWPREMCESCVSTALVAYSFKLNCLKANATLSQILNMNSTSNTQATDMDYIDINVVYQDHEYDVPLFSNNPVLDFENNLEEKSLTPLPSVSEITASEQPMRKESDKKYACTVCPKSFTRLLSLQYHMDVHANILRHLCAKCGKKFHTTAGLRQHLLSHKEVGQFKCGFCKKKYKSRQSLKIHFRVAHSSNRYLFMCTLCGKNFTAKSTLSAHLKVHNGLRQFACSECPKTYTRAAYLNLHKLTHKGEERPKPFECHHSECARKFSTKYSLSVHLAHAHSNERPHKCNLCEKSFATQSGLKVHKEFHCISCDLCGKKLANKRVLKKHLKSHEVDVDTNLVLETVVHDVFLDHMY